MRETIRFCLNLQMMADEMQARFPECVFIQGEDTCCLRGICFYQKGIQLEQQYVYIVKEEDLKRETVPQAHCSLIVLGGLPGEWQHTGHSVMSAAETDLLELMNFCQTIFQKHIFLGGRLQDILQWKEAWMNFAKPVWGIFRILFLYMTRR